MGSVDLIIMHGRMGASDVERMVDGARAAITRDIVERALAAGAFSSVIVSTNDVALAEMLRDVKAVTLELDPPGEPFHFGRRFGALVAKHNVERVVYLGGGSAPLLSADTLRDLAERVRDVDRLVVTNNFYSVDFAAFTPASAFSCFEPPSYDNSLGWLLAHDAGLPARELPRVAETVFDVDTPIDLMTLAYHPQVGRHTRAYLDSLDLDLTRLEAASAVFVTRGAEVLVAGRVSAATLAHLERQSLSRTRVFSEERGMRADGRLARGEVRSLLGMHVQAVGVERFFQEVVPQLGRAAFIDDRVVWAHCGLWPAAVDRFNSDLFRVERIADPFVRQFTEAAAACPVPVVLGGHSLVAGGLYALVEAAWERSGLNIEPRVQIG